MLSTSPIVVAGITLLLYTANAAGHASDTFTTGSEDIKAHPVSHASFVMDTTIGTTYVDPVGKASAYADLPAADLVLVTHELAITSIWKQGRQSLAIAHRSSPIRPSTANLQMI